MLEDLRRARDAAVQFVESVPAARGRNIVAFDSEIRAFDLAHRGAVEALDEILDQGEGRGTRLFTAVMRAIPLASVDPRGAVDLKSQFALIRNDIAAQYVLGFAPASSPPGRIHKLEVKVASENAKVRHRLAYTTTSRVQGPDTR